MNALRRILDRLLGTVVCVLMAAMVVNVCWQVFTRFVLKTPSSFTEEAARYMMIWAGLLGAAYAAGQKAHLALDLLTANLAGARKRASEIFIHLTALVFAVGVLGFGGGRLVWIQLSLGQQSAALQWKLGYIYLAVPVAGAFIAVYSLLGLIETLRGGEAGAGAGKEEAS
jgi:TRAP-type C4-dicarboxylate transport system permease small subunit